MTFGDDDDQDRSGVNEPVRAVPTLVWLMLGVILVLAFVAALVMVFGGPPAVKAGRALPPAERSPAPAQQVAPATPTPNPPPAEVH